MTNNTWQDESRKLGIPESEINWLEHERASIEAEHSASVEEIVERIEDLEAEN